MEGYKSMQHKQVTQKVNNHKKMWKPALRDTRSYREVVERDKLIVEVLTYVSLEKGLEKALVCYFKGGYSMKKSIREVEDEGIVVLASSRFNSIS